MRVNHKERIREWVAARRPGDRLVCRLNTYILDREGVEVEVDTVSAWQLRATVIADPSDRIDSGTAGYVIKLPTRAGDLVHLTSRAITYRARSATGERMTVCWEVTG